MHTEIDVGSGRKVFIPLQKRDLYEDLNLKTVSRDELEMNTLTAGWQKRFSSGRIVPFFTISSGHIQFGPGSHRSDGPPTAYAMATYAITPRSETPEFKRREITFAEAFRVGTKNVIDYIANLLAERSMPLNTEILCIGGKQPDARFGKYENGIRWLEMRLDVALIEEL